MRKTGRHIPIEDGSRGSDGGGISSLRGTKDLALRPEDIMSHGNEARGQSQDVSDGGQRIQFLKGDGIRAHVEDNNVAMMNEEGTRRGEVAGVDVGEGIVKELVALGGLCVEWRDLEDERNASWKGATGGGNPGNPRRRLIIFRSVGRHREAVVSKGLNKEPSKRLPLTQSRRKMQTKGFCE